MVALPAVKFVFLAVRQVTRPVARLIVSRANVKRALTYRVCVGLGRVSLGLTGVIVEWTREEAQRKSEVEQKGKTAQVTVDGDAITKGAAVVREEGSKSTSEKSSDAAASTPATVTPRSRSLLQSVVYGPLPKGGVTDTYDGTVFLDPSRTVGEAARVFIRYPTRSAWEVFRQTFLAPFPEERLVSAGADLLIELVAFTILCTLLVVELLQQSRTAAAKEAHLQARLEAIESKVNELVEQSNSSFASSTVGELAPVPEFQAAGRLEALWGAVKGGVELLSDSVMGNEDDTEKKQVSSGSKGLGGSNMLVATDELERLKQSGRVLVPLRTDSSSVPCAPPRDPAVKVSKYDTAVQLQLELDGLLRDATRMGKQAPGKS